MPRLDKMIDFLTKQGATRMEVPSDHTCRLTTPSGDRLLNRVLTRAEVEAMVEEVLPDDCRRRYEAGGTFLFAYAFSEQTFAVQISKTTEDLTLTLATSPGAIEQPKPSSSSLPTGTPAPPVASAAPTTLGPESTQASSVSRPETPRPAVAAPPQRVAQPSGPPSHRDYEPSAEPDVELIRLAEAAGAYDALDVLLLPDEPPWARFVEGVRPLEQFEALTPARIEELVLPLCPGADLTAPTLFGLPLGDRYRARFTVSQTRGRLSATARLLSAVPRTLAEIHAPEGLAGLASHTEGLILVFGRAGDGRTTTTAALVDALRRQRETYLITLSPALEYVHRSDNGIVSERELGTSPASWEAGLDAVAAERPGVVTLENLRAPQVLSAAVRLSQAGILVIAEVPATGTVAGMAALCRALRQESPTAVEAFAEVYCGSSFQVLCRTRNGGVRAAFEVVLRSKAIVASLQAGETGDLLAHARSGHAQGMVVLGEALLRLTQDDEIGPTEALRAACDKQEMRDMLTAAGRPVDDAG